MKLLVVNPDIIKVATEKAVAFAHFMCVVKAERVKLNTLLTQIPDQQCLQLVAQYREKYPAVNRFINAYELPHHPFPLPMDLRIDLINRRWPAIDVDWMAIDLSGRRYDFRSSSRVIAVNDTNFDLRVAGLKLRAWINGPEVPFQYSRKDYVDPEKDDWGAMKRSETLKFCHYREPESDSMMRYVCERLHSECTEFDEDSGVFVINDNKVPKIFKNALKDFTQKHKISSPVMFDAFQEFLYETLHGGSMSKKPFDVVHPRALDL